MLQNDYLLAKIGADPAENEPYVKSDVSWRWIRSQRGCLEDEEAPQSLEVAAESERAVRGA